VAHFIHYIRRRVRFSYTQKKPSFWFAEVQSNKAGLDRPRYHITRSKIGVASEIKSGDIIWLIAQLYSLSGSLPPAVDARIDVECSSMIRGKGGHSIGYRFQAAETSRWFPLADASNVLSTLKTHDSSDGISSLWPEPNKPIGYSLQRIRRLASGEPLINWQTEIDQPSFEFISYRVCDGTSSAFEKVKSCVVEGRSIFWDRWSLPRRLAERREKIDDPALEK
jgi:hypothetical protein